MKHIVLFLGLLSFAACSMHFTKPGASTQDFQHDWSNCEAKAGQAGYYGGLYKKNFMQNCMGGEGWTRDN